MSKTQRAPEEKLFIAISEGSARVVKDPKIFQEKMDEATEGEGKIYRFIPYDLALLAPDLLKENEELKVKLKDSETSVLSADVAIEFVTNERTKERGSWKNEMNSLKSLNAELLEALKEAIPLVNREYPEWEALISKAEGRNKA